MEILTKQFGTITLCDDKILTMPSGMPGFPGMNRFTILDHEELQPFHTLQSIDDPDLTFIIMDPFIFMPDYTIDVEPTLKEMGWDDVTEDDLVVFTIINASSNDPKEITANLLGPLLINTKINEAVQMVLTDGKYTHKHHIFDSLSKKTESA